MTKMELQIRDYTGVHCADCGFGLWKTRNVFERPTGRRSVVALVCETCFMGRPFGEEADWPDSRYWEDRDDG
jgi:hypothetical protein